MEKIIFIDKEKINDLFIDILKNELNIFKPNQKIAIKLHMGEIGNKYYLKPDFVKPIVKILKELNLNPFLFDSPVIYTGGRDTVEKYQQTAKKHGFTEQNIGCPIIISNDFKIIKTDHLEAQVCKPLAEVDNLLVLTHVKGHMCCGFGGSIKNLGMGGVTKKTKKDIHSFANPKIMDNCIGCGICVKTCPVGTISLKNNKAVIDYSGCWGCDQCAEVCPQHALKPKIASFETLIAESASTVLKNIKNTYYVNVLKDITELCDCCSNPGKIVVEDIGILMGKNIVAIEKASLDLINKTTKIKDFCRFRNLKISKKAGKDIFKEIHKKSPLEHINEAERLGLGDLEYELDMRK